MWVICLLLLIGAVLAVIYAINSKEKPEIVKILEPRKTPPPKNKEPVPLVQRKIPTPEEASGEGLIPPVEEGVEKSASEEENKCERVQRNVQAFFHVLDKKSYIHRLSLGMDTYDRFKRIIKRLESNPPVPAGEGSDPAIMAKNIFYLFRILDRKDIRLIQEILVQESDTLELNLDMFYRWLMLGNQCPNPEKIRPPLEVSYRYAGFFLNTIGGRAYLFRRPTRLRTLVSYYCLLIVNQADRKGMNRYGIDIFPLIAPVREELRLIPNLLLKKQYIQHLNALEAYYQNRR